MILFFLFFLDSNLGTRMVSGVWDTDDLLVYD
jgi:hypothetical protein